MSYCSDDEDIIFLRVKVNKKENKVLFAVADNFFADILLSFLTLPLGRIFRIVKKTYVDGVITIGSLRSLYSSLANLDSSHFWTEGAKEALLNPTSSFDAEHKQLIVDFSDSPPLQYFLCDSCNNYLDGFLSVSEYYDELSYCQFCRRYGRIKKIATQGMIDEAFAEKRTSFIITDDLHIFPNEESFARIMTVLGTEEVDEVEEMNVEFDTWEFKELLVASLISRTPLSDVILKKSSTVESPPRNLLQPSLREENNTRNMSLKLFTQKSTGKVLSYRAEEDFVEFLFSMFHIPLGELEHLFEGKTGFKAIDNLYRSVAELIDDNYFKTPETKQRLMKPNLPHGSISNSHILPLTEECLPASLYSDLSLFTTSANFPKGKGSYLRGPQVYEEKDDLTVTPYCSGSFLSSLKKQNIPKSDVGTLVVKIGMKEALSIVKASLSSISALSDALFSNIHPTSN